MRTKVTSHAGLLAYRSLDKSLGLFDRVPSVVQDLRTGRNVQHDLPAMLRPGNVHSSRMAGRSCWNRSSNLFRVENRPGKYFRGDAAFAKPEI